MKSGIAKKILAVAAFGIAFVAVKYGIQAFRDYQAADKVEQSLTQLQADATRKHSDIPVSEAMQLEAIEQTSNKLAAEPDEQKRAARAANFFWGFYFINVRERPEFCEEHGTRIQSFVGAFEKIHASEYTSAKTIYARMAEDESKIYTLIKPQLRKMIVLDMSDIAATNKITLKQACELIEENAEALVKEMHLAKMQPAVYRALSSGK
jgi:hypothetical protein